MESLAPVRHELSTSGIPVPVGVRLHRNKSPDLPVKRSNTEVNESADSGQKRRIFHRRTYSHDSNAVVSTGHKTKKLPPSGVVKANHLNTGAASSIVRRSNSVRRKRMRPVAHYDAQSVPLGVDSLMHHRGATTERLASGASSSHDSEEVGTGKANDLVQLCPKFITEIGGEWFLQDKGIGVVRQSLPKHMRYKVFSHLSCQVYEGSVVAEHWLPYSTNLSMNEFSRFSGANWELSNLSPYPLEFIDYGATYYRRYFADHDHQNFFGIDDNLGPLAVSLKKEKLDENPPFTLCSPLTSPKSQYRFIVRTSELNVLRGSVPEEAVQQSRGASTKNVSTKDVMDFIAPEVQLSCLKLAKADKKVSEELLRLDEQELNNRYKIGILYCAAGQTTEEQMYNNENGSDAFEEFLDFIGERVELKGFSKYRAGLDMKTGTTGDHSVYTEFRDCEIMFHVSTLLPFQPHNRQQLQRKRHIGNDIVTVVFQDPGSEPFSAKAFRSQFQHVFIVVRAHNPNTPNTEYSVAVTRLKDVPYFGPALPENGRFKKNEVFRELLRTKLVNAENAGHRCEKFMQMAIRTRSAYLQELATQHSTQQTVDTGSGSGLGILRGFSRRKEKVNVTTQYLAFSPAAVVWSGHLLLDDLGSRPQPVCSGGSASISIEVLLSLSIDSLSLVEVESRQVLLHLPTSCITGWMPNGNRLLIFFDGVECLSFELTDTEEEDIMAAVGTRLNAVAPHATKGISVEVALSSVANISVDNGLVMSHCSDASIQQGDHIVQVGSMLTCTDKYLFQTVKHEADFCDELAEVVILRHPPKTLPPVVYSVMREDLSWEKIWSARPEHLSATAEPAPLTLESPNTAMPEDSATSKKRAPQSRIPGPGFSSSAVAKLQQRPIRKSQNRTYSYIQAVDKDNSHQNGDSEGSSEGSRNTSPFPSGPVSDSSEKVVSPLSQRKAVKSAPGKEHTPTRSIQGLASNEKNVSPRDDSSGAGDELQRTPASEKATSPWRKGRVSELRAVFAKKEEGTTPPLPDSVYLSASGRPLSSDESPLVSPVSKHPVYKEPGTPTGDRSAKPVLVSNRFGFVSGSAQRTAGPLSPRPVGHDSRTPERDVVKPATPELAEPTNAEKRSRVGLSVRDRTANWERRHGFEYDAVTHTTKPGLDCSHSFHAGSKENISNQLAAVSLESLRRKSAGDFYHSQGGIPIPKSVSSRKGNESGSAQRDRPWSEAAVGQQSALRKPTAMASAMASAHPSDNLPSYAHRFTSSGTSRTTPPKGHAPADNQLSLSLKRLGPKSALQGNVSNNNNGSKGAVCSRVRTNAFSTKLPTPVQSQVRPTSLPGSNRSDATLGQVSTTQQPLPKPITLTHPASSPKFRLKNRPVERTQSENGDLAWGFRRNSSEQVQPKQSLIRKQPSFSQSSAAVHYHPAATSGLPTKSLKERRSSAETLTGATESRSLARRSSPKDRRSPQLKGSVESVEEHQDGLVAKEECVYPGRISREKELSNTTLSSMPFERQLSTDSHSTATYSIGDSVVSPAMPPEGSQVCMDDISSDIGSGEVSDEDVTSTPVVASREVNKLQQKVRNLKDVLDQERRGKEELEDAMLLMKKELSLLREMRHPPLIPE